MSPVDPRTMARRRLLCASCAPSCLVVLQALKAFAPCLFDSSFRPPAEAWASLLERRCGSRSATASSTASDDESTSRRRAPLLTRKLAQLLGRRAGRPRCSVDASGRRLRFTQTVVKLSDEPLASSGTGFEGRSAGCSARKATSPACASRSLSLDVKRNSTASLQRIPAVGAVAIRSAMLYETIRDVTDRSFLLVLAGLDRPGFRARSRCRWCRLQPIVTLSPLSDLRRRTGEPARCSGSARPR